MGAPIDLASARATFEASTDFTVGLEEEFALLDPATLDMVPRFEELRDAAAQEDPILAAQITGELISSELEIVSGRGEDLHDAIARQRDLRRRLFMLARSRGIALGSTATHPWADYREQHNIDTEHYRRVVDGLGYAARRNNTFSLHVHVGVQGADRAVRTADRMRPVLPALLAYSANSPFVDGRDAGLHSARTMTFTRTFPRCGVPDAYGSWAAYRDYIDLLVRTRSIVEYTQVWWSVRPHFSYGTVEVRICDAQSSAARVRGGRRARRRVRRAGRARRRGGSPVRGPRGPVRRGEPLARGAPRDGRQPPRSRRGDRDPGRRRRGGAGGVDGADPGRAGHRGAAHRRAPERRPASDGRPCRGRRSPRGLRFHRSRDGRDVRSGRRGEAMSTQGPQPNEEELRAAYEAELKRLRVEDVLVQTVVSLLNLGGRKAGLAPGTEDERDPEQLRLAIEGARALLPLVEPVLGAEASQVREILSQLQMTYAQTRGAAPASPGQPGADAPPEPPAPEGGPGSAQGSGRLWIPGQ